MASRPKERPCRSRRPGREFNTKRGIRHAIQFAGRFADCSSRANCVLNNQTSPVDSRRQQLHEKEGHHVGQSRHHEDEDVRPGPLQDVADGLGNEHSADHARHGAEADDGAHGIPRKHVGGQRVNIRRPALMGSCGDRNQRHRQPCICGVCCNHIGVTANAQTSIAVLRLAFSVHPLFKSEDESHPPPMLPTLAPV